MDLVLVFVTALAFYGATLAPTVIWGDSAWYVLYIALGSSSLPGASAHPLYLKLGRLFYALPGDPARSVAFQSAVFAALAVMLVYLISRQLGCSRLASSTGAGALAVSHAFWLHAVIPEVYTANAFFLLAALSLAIKWSDGGKWVYLAACTLVFGLGLTNHIVLAAVLPALVLFVAISKPGIFLTRRALVIGASIVMLLGAAVLVIPPLAATARRIWVGPPGIAEYVQLTVPLAGMMREAGYYLMYLLYQFPSPAILLAAVGVWALLRNRPRAAVLLVLTIAVNAGVFIHHTGWQSAASSKFVFYIADYAVFAVFCGCGANEAVRWLEGWAPALSRRRSAVLLLCACVALPLALYTTLPKVANALGMDLVMARSLPYRDNQTFFLNPNKRGYQGARRFGEEALATVPPSAVIFADYTPFSVLRYLQLVEQVRPDVLLRFADQGDPVRVRWEEQGGRRRPTYIASLVPGYYDLTGLTGSYDLLPAGPIVEVRPRD